MQDPTLALTEFFLTLDTPATCNPGTLIAGNLQHHLILATPNGSLPVRFGTI